MSNWKSSYTDLVHLLDELSSRSDSWAYVACMRSMIPGEKTQAELTCELCKEVSSSETTTQGFQGLQNGR